MDEPLVILDNSRLTALDPATGAVRWSAQVPESSNLFARMVITEGVVVVAGIEWIYCVDLKTGQPLWRVKQEGSPVGVVVRSGRIFVYCRGSVDCYDGRGQRLWRHEGKNHYGASFGFTDDICWVVDRS